MDSKVSLGGTETSSYHRSLPPIQPLPHVIQVLYKITNQIFSQHKVWQHNGQGARQAVPTQRLHDHWTIVQH